MNAISIYYDKQCQLCRIMRRQFMKWKKKNVEVSWNHFTDAPACGIRDYACGESMKVMTPDGTMHQAFFAVRILIRYSRLSVLAPLFYFPGVEWLGQKLYAWVARNRHKLFGTYTGADDEE